MKFPEVYKKLNTITPIGREEWLDFESFASVKDYDKNEILLRVGEKAHKLGFILKGAIRFYYITEKGEEFNRAFRFEGEMASGFASLVTHSPSFMEIQTMEASSLLEIPFQDFSTLLNRHRTLERLTLRLLEMHYLGKERREFEFLTMDAANRYQSMLKHSPGIDKRVPQFHLASYLGITASSLNRIIKSLEK